MVDMSASFNKTSAQRRSGDRGLLAVVVRQGHPGRRRRHDDTTAENCWGDSSALDNACYLEVDEADARPATSWRVPEGHPRRRQPRPLYTPTRRSSRASSTSAVPAPDDRLHVPGRAPDRGHPRLELLGLRDHEHDRAGGPGHRRHAFEQGHPADRRRLRGRDRHGRVPGHDRARAAPARPGQRRGDRARRRPSRIAATATDDMDPNPTVGVPAGLRVGVRGRRDDRRLHRDGRAAATSPPARSRSRSSTRRRPSCSYPRRSR